LLNLLSRSLNDAPAIALTSSRKYFGKAARLYRSMILRELPVTWIIFSADSARQKVFIGG
jgi:hypothetical protein